MNISRNFLRVPAGLALIALAAACAKQETSSTPTAVGALETEAQQFSYAIGVDLGKSLQPVKDDVDLDALRAGLDDAFAGGEVKLDDAAREQIKNTIARKMMDKRKAERDAQATTNREEGAKFMAENAKKEGVKTTESGLQYEVLVAGEGNHPAATDQVTVHYKGTLINGEEFDSSYSRGEPVTFPLNGVIKGWTEGVQLMTKGSKFRFVIPADLAYGERGAGVKIGPNETLVFEVELLDFAPAKAAAEGADAH